MTDTISLSADVQWPDHARAIELHEALTTAPDSAGLGRLVALAEWVAAVHPGEAGADFAQVRAVVLGASPGAVALDALDAAGVSVLVVTDLPESPADALAAGVQLADGEADRGTDLVILAAPGMGADACLAVSVLTNTEPAKVLTRGVAATDPQAWMALAVEVRDRRRAAMAEREEPDKLLDVLASARLAAITGFALRAAGRSTPVVLDGPTVAAGALIAYQAQPRATRWWCTADVGPDAMHELALTRLGQQALLGAGIGLGDGLAGALALPLLRAAARLGAST